MNRAWIGGLTAAALGLIGPSAFAADLPLKAPPLPAPVFTWTGCYIGGHGAGAWSRGGSLNSTPGTAFFGGAVIPVYSATNTNSFAVGAQDGCNYQINPWLVVGIESDLDIIHDNPTLSSPTAAAIAGGLNPLAKGGSAPDFQSTTRARIGVTGWNNRVLFFATGGVAYQNVQSTQEIVLPPNFVLPGTFNQQFDNRWGWTVGGGIEYAISNNLIARAEYLFVQIPRYNTFTQPPFFGGPPVPLSTQTNTSMARFGLSYKFTDKLFWWM